MNGVGAIGHHRQKEKTKKKERRIGFDLNFTLHTTINSKGMIGLT